MPTIKKLEDSSTVIGDGNLTKFINHHFIKSLRAKRSLNNVCDGSNGLN